MKARIFYLLLTFWLVSFASYGQISGKVFLDGNNDGTQQSVEVGFAGVTVTATPPSGPALTATTGTSGTYTITGTSSGTTYRIEFTYPTGYADGAIGTQSETSVTFATGNATNVDLGLNVPASCDPDMAIRVLFGSGLDDDGTPHSVRSWDYIADRRDAITGMGSAGDETPHTNDILATQSGVPYGFAVQKGTNLSFYTTISSDLTNVFPNDPSGEGIIRVASYDGPLATYQSMKQLLNFSSYGISTSAIAPTIDGTFGTHGLGGIAISDDGRYLYVINMGKRNIVRFDISSVNYASIPAGGVTGLPFVEIPLPNPSCPNGVYRPGALKYYAGNLYLGGICDANAGAASDLRAVFYRMAPATNTFTQVLSYTPNFLAGGIRSFDWAHARWSSSYPSGDSDNDPGAIQPHIHSIAFDDTGSMIIGTVNREVYVDAGSDRETGYLMRTWRESDGTFTLENGGVSGPYTSTGRMRNVDPGSLPGNYTPNPPSVTDNGPGGDWFFENGRTSSHPYLYAGGAMVIPGTGYVVAGFADPGAPATQTGARYIDIRTGRTEWGTSVIGAKATVMSGTDAACEDPTTEVGNRVWMDTDGDGIQDPDEAPLAGVTVQLIKDGNVIATANTDANGNYYFSSATGTNTASAIYDIMELDPNMIYIVRIPNVQGGSKQTALGTNSLTTANADGTANGDLRDSDGTLVGNNAEVTVLTTDIAVAGANNHTFDFGFGSVACAISSLTATPSVCNASTNTYSVSGSITFTDAPATGTLTVGIGGVTQTFNAPFSSPQAYTITGLTADAASHTVTAVFSADAACTATQTYTAPASCAVTGDCACNDMVYLNDTGIDHIHKFKVNSTNGALTEIGSPWMNANGVVEGPHGIAPDINGFMYITQAEAPHFVGKFTCDGVKVDADISTPATIDNLVDDVFSYDLFSLDNKLYVNAANNVTGHTAEMRLYDLCSGEYLGCQHGAYVWSTAIGPDEYWYGSHGDKILRGLLDPASFSGTAGPSGTCGTVEEFMNATELGLDIGGGEQIQGMDFDAVGNMYVVYTHGGGYGPPSKIVKIDPVTKTVTDQSLTDSSAETNEADNLNWAGARGLVYSKSANMIYVSSMDDCVAAFDTDLNYVGAASNHAPAVFAKQIGIVTECCPMTTPLTYNETVCSGGNGEKIYLQDVLDCGDGVICEGMWDETSNTSGGNIVFNECDLSITVNGSGCATYTLSKTTPATGNQQCGAFNITLTVCTVVPVATLTPNTGSCTAITPNNDASIVLSAVVNADQAGFSTGATYSGPAYGQPGTVNITGGGTITGLMHNTEYTVRIFNGSNDCYVDYTVTIPDIACCALTVDCTPQPQTNCSPVNGSASVTASNAVGTVTYLWSSGETTSSISNKAAGTYTVTVTDGGVAGCTATCQAIIANNANPPSCAITVNTQPSCANLTGGDITVVPNPAATYTYTWSDNGAATATRKGLTGGTYTVTVTNTTSNCTGMCNVILDTPTNCCEIQAIVPQNIECLDNGTPALITDNRIRFSANVTNTNASLTEYNITINGGTTITPNINIAYGTTQFTLGPGTAGGGATFTIIVTDSATPGCTQTFQVTDPGGCNNAIICPQPNCGTATIQVNGN
ncbi:MAG: hypothetical protein IPN86_03715 [Saprospiraceae bacterium]|nr:hypothetical protein [Saprospiraceae bacterium]